MSLLYSSAPGSQTVKKTTVKDLLKYALPGLPLASLGLPFYIYAPVWLAEQGGYGYATVGALFFLARITDVFTDLPTGAAVDRFGSRRSLWLLGWLLMALSAAALMGVSHPWPSGLMLLSLITLMLGWTMINVPWLALPVLLSRNDNERLAFNSAREAMLLFGTLIAMLAPAILDARSLPAAAAGMLLFLLVAITAQGSHRPTGAQQRRFGELLGDRRVRALALPWFVNMLANAIPGTVLVLFMREVLEAEAMIPATLLSYFLAGLLAVPAWYALARRWGSLNCWRLGLILSAILFALAVGLSAGDAYAFIAISIGTGLMLGADQALPSAMQTGLARQLMNESDATIAARLFALWSMLGKAAMGLAVGIGYLWLGSQLQPAQSTVPPGWAITAAYVAAPVALKILVFFMLGRPQLRYLNEEVHNA